MSTPVLYDVPGPKTRRRHLISGVVGAVVVAAAIAWIVARLNSRDQFDSEKWKPFTLSGIWQNTLIPGIETTLKTAAIAIALAVGFGALMATLRLSDHWFVRMPAVVIVEFFRAVPVLLLMLFFLIAFSDSLSSLWIVVLALTLYNGAVLAETFRAGIVAIPRGQVEAANSLGLRKHQVMRLVLLPQAVRAMLPAIISQCVVTLKDTSLGYIISYGELVHSSKPIYETYQNIIPTAIVLTAMYVVVNWLLSRLATWLESRQRRHGVATVSARENQASAT